MTKKNSKKDRVLAAYYATRTVIAPVPEVIMQRLQDLDVSDRMIVWKYLEHAARKAWIKKAYKFDLIDESEANILVEASEKLLEDSLKMYCRNEQ